MAADENALSALHNKVAQTLSKALDGTTIPAVVDEETGEVQAEEVFMPPSAAFITATIQFLKNNNITCTPADDNSLGELEAKLKAQQANRKNRLAKPDKADFALAAEAADFRTGLPN
ncbi:small terminase [Caulobacter phage Percy]|uniref:Small terminase n=1 Tax=Caulobacter phage Percy TaxID=1701809 RepID=A0A0M3UL69_9CAUD|nr:terminase small subunit [Caulobacter phage Percy]ALF01683.1 small terminase [Caulobacter phage Percy]